MDCPLRSVVYDVFVLVCPFFKKTFDCRLIFSGFLFLGSNIVDFRKGNIIRYADSVEDAHTVSPSREKAPIKVSVQFIPHMLQKFAPVTVQR